MALLRSALARRFIASVNAGVFSRVNNGLESPVQFPGNAAWYDAGDVNSMRNNAGNIPSNGEGIKLWADKSGNSSVNVLCLNGVAGNYASAPDSAALSITGDIDIRVNMMMVDWTPGSIAYVVSKWVTAGNQKSYNFGVLTTGGLEFGWSADGSTTISKTSTATVSFTDLTSGWIRVTLDVDNGSTQNEVKFYTSTDGVTWNQLGATVTTAGVTSIFDNSQILNIGRFGDGTNVVTGNIHRCQIYAGLTGTDLRFDANFATAAKLAPSFTESSSNAATVTINTSGATGARISGARDLYQGTAANQPILTIAAGGNYLTFDGGNDYLKAAAFALAQPETVYWVGQQVTWPSAGRYAYDGGSLHTMALQTITSTPQVRLRNGAVGGAEVTTLTLATNFVTTSVWSGAASGFRVNRGTITTDNMATTAANGFTLGVAGDGSTGFHNITASEVLVYSTADSTAVQDAKILYLGRHNGIAV